MYKFGKKYTHGIYIGMHENQLVFVTDETFRDHHISNGLIKVIGIKTIIEYVTTCLFCAQPGCILIKVKTSNPVKRNTNVI